MDLKEAKERTTIFIQSGKEYFEAYDECFITKEELEAIETVLAELEKTVSRKQYEKTKKTLKGIINKQNKEIKKKDNDIRRMQELLDLSDANNVKKDKIIDLMAEELEDLKLAYFKKEDGGELIGKYRTYNKNDWKQYFTEKVEGK